VQIIWYNFSLKLTKSTQNWIAIILPGGPRHTCDSASWRHCSCQTTTDCLWNTAGCQLSATVVPASSTTCHRQHSHNILQSLTALSVYDNSHFASLQHMGSIWLVQTTAGPHCLFFHTIHFFLFPNTILCSSLYSTELRIEVINGKVIIVLGDKKT